MLAFYRFLVVFCINSVSLTASEFSPSEPPPFYTVGEAKYRISTAKLTISIPTRKFIKLFALTEEVELELGRPDHSLVREVQSTLAALVIAETKWNSTGMGPSSRIRWNKIDELVKQLSEVLKSWPGVLIDQFVLGAMEDFDETVEYVQDDFDELNQMIVEYMRKWNFRKMRQLDELALPDELYDELKLTESSINHFHTALLHYLKVVKHLWETDRILNSTYEQKALIKALLNVKIRVTSYHATKSTLNWQKCLRLIVINLFAIPYIVACLTICREFFLEFKEVWRLTRARPRRTRAFGRRRGRVV